MYNMNPPKTYSEWVTLLDMLRNKTDDAAVLGLMSRGNLAWQSGVAERFLQKLMETVNYRLNAASDKFDKDNGRARDEGAVVRALLALRKDFKFLADLITNLNAVPEEQRQQIYQMVIDHANNVQRSLEDSAKSDRSGKMSSIVRNHKVNKF